MPENGGVVSLPADLTNTSQQVVSTTASKYLYIHWHGPSLPFPNFIVALFGVALEVALLSVDFAGLGAVRTVAGLRWSLAVAGLGLIAPRLRHGLGTRSVCTSLGMLAMRLRLCFCLGHGSGMNDRRARMEVVGVEVNITQQGRVQQK